MSRYRRAIWLTSPPRWVVGTACTILGAALLIAPHHVLSTAGALGSGRFDLSGWALVLAGLLVLCVETFRPVTVVTVAVHCGAALVLGRVAWLFGERQLWAPFAILGAITVTVALVPLLERRYCPEPAEPDPASASGADPKGRVTIDLLTLMLSAIALIVGLTMLGLPAQIVSESRIPLPELRAMVGIVLVVASSVVFACELAGRSRTPLATVATVVLVSIVTWRLVAASIPDGNWAGAALLATIAAYPVWRRLSPSGRLSSHSSSMRARLALLLASAATLPLLLAATEFAAREEALATDQIVSSAQTLAGSIAYELDEILTLNAAAVTAAASQPGLASLDRHTHTSVMTAFGAAYPSMSYFSSYDRHGEPLARSDSHAPIGAAGRDIFERVVATGLPICETGISVTMLRPVVRFAAPIRNEAGTVVGVVIASVETDRVATHLRMAASGLGPDTRAYVVDRQGRSVVHLDPSIPDPFADISSRPTIAAALALADTVHGGPTRTDAGQQDAILGGFGHVPGSDWIVAIERDAATALLGVRAARDRLLFSLVVGAIVAGSIGTSIARRIAEPLKQLTQAAEALASGAAATHLPTGGPTELVRLARAFRLMRDRLSARTAEREAAERALAASEARFRHVAEQAPDVVIRRELTPVDRYAYVSPSITRILGYTPEDYYADVRFSNTLAYPGDTFTSYAADTGGRPNELEVHRLRHKDGHWVWIETKRTCFEDERGNLIGYEAICRDVTERVEHAQAIERSETRLRMALEAAEMSFWEIDPVSLRIWRTSQSAALAGTATSEELGETLDEVLARIHPEDRERVRTKLLSAAVDGTMVEHSWRIVWPDGTIRWLESQGRAMRRESDGTVRLFGTTKDVTARRAAEDALVQANAALAETAANAEALAREAKAASRAKSEFLATMSHEIRTPLNGVVGLTALLLDDDLSPSQREDATMIRSSAEALRAIVDDILDFSKIEAGHLKLETLDLDLRGLVDETISILAEQARQRDLVLDARIAPDLPDGLRGDPIRLRQILLNLVGNAIKFTERGSVQVRVTRGALGADDECAERSVADAGRARFDAELVTRNSQLVTFAVSDTGIGIPSDVQARLFEPFTQADSSTTRQYGGTGLGLAICKQLVDLMGGQIGVASEPGSGSTFWFTVPLQSAHRAASDTPWTGSSTVEIDETAAPAPRRLPILVVDDNPINRKVTARIAERLGYDVHTASDGDEAVAAAARQLYAAILMDCQMPKLDGYEATATIRAAEPPGQRVPIVALTANALGTVRDECLAAGMDDFLSKPTTVNDVATVLRRWVGPGTSPRPALSDATEIAGTSRRR